MKLSKEALLEIVAIIQEALINGKDASEGLRELDLKWTDEGVELQELVLSKDYLRKHPRINSWGDEDSSEET